MNKRMNRSEKYRSLATGISKRLSGTSSILLDGSSQVPADLAKLFTSIADALDAAPALRAAWLTSARSAASAEQKAHALMVAFVKWVKVAFGKEPAAMQDFGLPAPAPHPAKAATKAEAQVKAKATRQSKKAPKAQPAGEAGSTAPKS